MSAPWLDAPASPLTRPGPWDMSNLLVYVGPWAQRTLPNQVPIGSKSIFTDIGVGGRSEWYSDGTYWRPVNGNCTFYLLSAPLVGVASANSSLTFPDVTFPAGLLFPGASVIITQVTNLGGGTATVLNYALNIGGRTLCNSTASPGNRNRYLGRIVSLSGSDQYTTSNTSAMGPGITGLSAGGAGTGTNFLTNAVVLAGSISVTDAGVNQISLTDYLVEIRG